MDFVFCGSSIDECLKKASEKLDIDKNELKYKVIKEERKFFKKSVEIQILNILEKDKENSKEVENKNNSGAKVEKGKIIIVKDNDEPIKIKPGKNIKLFLNGIECEQIDDAKEDDEISYEFETEMPKKNIDVFISEDKMNVFMTVESIPQPVYELIDTEYTNSLELNAKITNENYPEKYTKEEIIDELNVHGVVYGIIEENINKLCNVHNYSDMLVAKGRFPVDDTDDYIEIMFKSNKSSESLNDNNKVDYRNINSIVNVKAGDVLATKTNGKEGSDGYDVFNKPVKRKIGKLLTIKSGTGCHLEENNVVSDIEGRPSVKNNIFTVNSVYDVEEVNLSSGNIIFVGDVEVAKNVDEGMIIKSGKSVTVGKNVDSATIIANEDITIKGNVVTSTIKAGCDQVEQARYIQIITKLESNMEELMEFVEQIKHNDSFKEKSYGEIIKILIENRFKTLSSTLNKLFEYYHEKQIEDCELESNLKDKLVGAGPLEIKEVSELEKIKVLLSKELEQAREILESNSDIYLEYCQGSKIEAAGSVYITGKGQFTSEITSLNNIEFTKEGSVCRGGILYAKNEIKLKTVGSNADVKTTLKVSKKGRISAEMAYSNTIFCFGERQFVLDVPSRNVIAYLDGNDEVVVEKLKI